MQDGQHYIDGWKHQTIDSPSPHPNQLKNLIQFIDKAKFESLRLHNKKKSSIFNEQTNNRDGRSFQSVKQLKKRLKTFTERIKLKAFVEKDIDVSVQKRKLNEEIISSPMNRVKAFDFNSFLTLQEKLKTKRLQQPRANPHGDRQKGRIFNHSNVRSSSTKQFSRFDSFVHRSVTKRELKLSKNERRQFDIKTLVTLSNEDRMKKLKTILFRSIEEKRPTKSIKQQNKYDIRLKNMLEKSNRKKKKLEKLFRVNEWINESKISTALQANKIQRIIAVQSTKEMSYESKRGGIENYSRNILHFNNI